jgi:hypothetical protein
MSLDACIAIEVVRRLIYRKAVPASNALMYVLTDFGFEKTNRLENVFIGQSDRYEKIGNYMNGGDKTITMMKLVLGEI